MVVHVEEAVVAEAFAGPQRPIDMGFDLPECVAARCLVIHATLDVREPLRQLEQVAQGPGRFVRVAVAHTIRASGNTLSSVSMCTEWEGILRFHTPGALDCRICKTSFWYS